MRLLKGLSKKFLTKLVIFSVLMGIIQFASISMPGSAYAATGDPGSISTSAQTNYLEYAKSTAFAFGTGDFTIEYWYKPTGTGRNDVLDFINESKSETLLNRLDLGSNIAGKYVYTYSQTAGTVCDSISQGTITANVWQHVALTRKNGTLDYWVNGGLQGSGSCSIDLGSQGYALKIWWESGGGNLADVRVVKGKAMYTSSFTPATSFLGNVSGTENGTSFSTSFLLNTRQGSYTTDSSASNLIPITNTVSTSLSTPFSGSINFNGTNQYLSIAGNANTAMGTSDFTWETWVKTTSSTDYQAFIDSRLNPLGGGDTTGFYFGTNFNSLYPMFYTNVIQAASSIPLNSNSWNHVALVRKSGVVKIYVNGVNGISGGKADTTNLSNQRIFVGSSGAGLYLNGKLSNLRIVKGTAIYEGDFTVPVSPLTKIMDTALLLRTSDGDNNASDMSINTFTVTKNNSPSSSTDQPFTGIQSQLITFGSLANKTLGMASFNLSATGGGSGNQVTFESTSAACTVVGTTATLVSAGTCTINANQLGNASYNAASQLSRSFTIASAISITTPTSGLTGTFGTSYSLAASTSGGGGSNSYAITSGTLQAGLSLNSSTGAVSGTPTVVGDSLITISVTDANGASATTSAFTISVQARSITISADNKSAAHSGSAVSVTNTFSISSGTLAATNSISGVTYTYSSVGGYNSTTAPTAVGTYSITPSAAVFSSGSSGNYVITYTAGTLTISSVPVISSTSASSITSTSANINFTSSTSGNYYLLIYASADTAPTVAEVMTQGAAIKKASASVIASSNTINITGLTLSTAYKVYVVVKDGLNLNSTVSTIEFTTLMAAPNAPGFRSARVKVIADNDYAVFMGSDRSITRILHQSNVDWPSQVASIGTLDVFPLAGETYMYVLAMGGNVTYIAPGAGSGGEEDWAGTINGRSVFEYPGAQVAVNRAVADPFKTDILHSGYLLLNNYLPNYAASRASVEGGTYAVDVITANDSIKDVVWGPATLTEAQNGTLPYKTNCTVSCREIDSGVTVRGWDFPDQSAVIFRYPLSNAQLPVTAGDKQVVVDWDAPVGGGVVAKYLVDYKESSEPDGAYKSFSEVAAGTTIETVTGLTNGTSYTFRVTAVNAGGTASSVSRAVTPTGAPSQPLNLSYAAGAGYVDVSFTAPENNGGFNITNYSYSIDNGANWVTRSPQSTTSPMRISGLTDGTTYQVKLKAINPSGAGLASTVIAAKPGITINRTVSYVSGTLATIAGLPTGGTYLAGDTFRIASGPTRTNFTFTGWKDGATSYQPGDTFTVGASNSTLTAQWTQDSLLGTTAADRSRVLTWNIVADTAVDATVSGGADNSVRVQIPANSLAPGTEVIFWRLLNDNVAKSKINSGNSYLVNLAVTWSIGDDVTTAKTVQTAAAPLVLTVTNGSIKAGATAWQIIGDNVRVIGTATQDGLLNLSFTEDPVIAAANVANPPVFGATTSTADGFTVSITNYDVAYVWEDPTISAGSVAITSTEGSTRLLRVTGLTIGQSATISQSNSLSGVANSSRTTTVTGSAIAGAALNPVFGAATATADGFTISITNYDSAYTWATPTVSSGTVTVTSTSGTNRLLTVTGLSSGGSATITQSTSRIGYSGGSRTATGTAITATPVVVQQPVVPAPVEPAPVVQGPPPSTLKITSRSKISRDAENLYCQAGKFLFLREGRIEESAKLSTQVFSLIQNGKVVDSSKSANEKVAFAIKPSYLDTTLSCLIEAEQENLTISGQSLDFEIMSKLSKEKNLAITSADGKYYSDREAAYVKKAQSFAELGKIKDAALAAAKSSKEIVTARMTYQKAYTAASSLWKKELADAASNRVLAKEFAQKQYLVALEAAGISIYPKAEKAVVTPTPTPTPTVKPTPTPSPIATNVQPTAEMKKVGIVYMATGSYVLNASTKITLKALALQINAQQIKQVLVYGHTDSRGGVNNTTLSQNRAKAVANYLRPLLKGKKIVIGWYASRQPVTTGTTAADLAKNRRVEIYTK